MLLAVVMHAQAQAPQFATSRSTNNAYNTIGATGTSFSFQVANTDDNISAAVPLPAGFAFTYLGTPVTGFVASTNGWISLDPTVMSVEYHNNLGGTAIPMLLAPFWEDLVCQGNNSTMSSLLASMKYQVSGTAPNRVLTVEWLGMEVYRNTGPNLNFQISLFETTNVIQYQYGVMSGFNGANNYYYTYSVGLGGAVPATSHIAQQVANSNFFAQANATTQNAGANGLAVVPESYSQLQFVPAAALSTGTAPSPVVPANNEPAGAFTLPLIYYSPTSFAKTYSSANATASAGIAACAATTPGNPDDDVWFKFTLPSTQAVSVTLRGSGGYDGVLQLFSNMGTTPVACLNATGQGLTETYSSASLPAGTYYVRVYEAGVGSGAAGQFAVAVSLAPAMPTNNECAAAIALTSSGACAPVSGTTLGATASAGVPVCVGVPDDDVWYSFTTAATARTYTLIMQGSPDFDGVVQVLGGACGSQTSVNCTDNTLSGSAEVVVLTNLAVNTTYYVRVYDAEAGAGSGDFTLCLTDNLPRITNFTPTSGPVGTSVVLTGTGFGGATSVNFSGAAQTTITAVTATGLTVAVPTGAITGTLTVTTPVGTSAASSQTFTVVSSSVLSSVAPNPGGLGQSITLTGANLGSPTALTINGANALGNVISNTGTSVVVRVPLTATPSGNVSLTTASGTVTRAFAVIDAPGNALVFDGVSDEVRTSTNAPAFGTGSFTIEAWVRTSTTSNNAFVAVGSSGNNAYWLGIVNQHAAISVSGAPCEGTKLINDDRWHHIAGVRNGNALTIYVDGLAERTITNSANASPAAPLGLGSFGNGTGFWPGSLDEVRLWNVAQLPTPTSITTPLIGNEPGLVRYFNFDQGTSAGANAGLNTLYDLTSNATVATLSASFSLSGPSSNYVESYALVVPTAMPATSATPTGFTATWRAPAAGRVTGYVLDVATNVTFAAPIAGSPFTVAASATSHAVTGLTRNATYYYRVRALNAALPADQGAFSRTTTIVSTPLPVELSAFTASLEGNAAVRLAWATATEKNSAHFEVERSLDGTVFNRIGTVAAAGNSSATHSYTLADAQLPTDAARLYYRLRQVDLDGTASYSAIRSVTRRSRVVDGLTLAPNPARATTLAGVAAGAKVEVFDAPGRRVLTATADAAGAAILVLPSYLPSGIYVVRSGGQAVRLVAE